MSSSSNVSNAESSLSFGRLLRPTLILLLVAGIAYWYGVNSVQPAGDNEALRIYGLGEPRNNKLSDEFSDADSNGVADTPADEADQLNPTPVVFSYLASDQGRYQEVWSGFLEELANKVGKPVEFQEYDTVEDQLRALHSGDLHVVGLNTGAVPFAVDVCGFVPVCAFGNEGKPVTYTMKVIANSNSTLEGLAGLKGRKLTLTNPTSNSGWKAPLVVLLEEFQMQPVRDFEVIYSNGHAESIEGIASKSYEVAAVASDELALAIQRGLITESDFKTIYISEPYCNNVVGLSHRLNPELAKAIREGLLSISWEDSSLDEEFSSMGVSEFVSVTYPDDLSLIRKIDDTMGRPHTIDAIQSSDSEPNPTEPTTSSESTKTNMFG